MELFKQELIDATSSGVIQCLKEIEIVLQGAPQLVESIDDDYDIQALEEYESPFVK